MRKLIVSMFTSVDGLISGPAGELDWMPGNGTIDPEVDADILALLDTVDTILLGRRTYEEWVTFWPSATIADDVVADKLNATKKLVCSRTLQHVTWGKWNNAHLIASADANAVEGLKRDHGRNIVVFGGASLVRSLTELGVVDEYRLIVAPVVLGDGVDLFGRGTGRVSLSLVDEKRFASGAVLLRYRPQ